MMTHREADALEDAMLRKVERGELTRLYISDWSLPHSFSSFIEEFDIKGPFPGLSKRWRA